MIATQGGGVKGGGVQGPGTGGTQPTPVAP